MESTQGPGRAHNDEESPDVAAVGSRKRTINETDNVTIGNPNQRVRVPNETQHPGRLRFFQAPIKLFATKIDEEERLKHIHDRNHMCWSQCHTLREMLRFDVVGEATEAIEWLVIVNYIIDFDYLLDYIPELLSVKHVVVFYGVADSDPNTWKQAIHTGQTIHFVCLKPSDAGRSLCNPLPYSIPYGVHHSKMFLIGYSNATCRVIIHTANIRHGDIHLKAQAAYICDFPRKVPNVTLHSGGIEFETTLVAYLATYEFHQKQKWSPDGDVEDLIATIRRYDYSDCKVFLVPSVPGYHSLDANETFGHLKLRKLVSQWTYPPTLPEKARPIICQFSSIGSLTEKYLRELQVSMDTGLARSSQSQSMSPSIPLRLQLVYPTVDEICRSIEGYRGGGSVPGTRNNVGKPFLRSLWRKWTTRNDHPRNPLCKPKHVPHIKTYYQVCRSGNSMEWLAITSHNLSKAAWGEVQNSTRHGGRRMFIRHWELGVFVSPSTLHCDQLVYWANERSAQLDEYETLTNESNPDKTIYTVPMPYEVYYPQPYQSGDKPWAVDETYEQEDSFGRHSTQE